MSFGTGNMPNDPEDTVPECRFYPACFFAVLDCSRFEKRLFRGLGTEQINWHRVFATTCGLSLSHRRRDSAPWLQSRLGLSRSRRGLGSRSREKSFILVAACLLLKLHESGTRRAASRAPESPGDAMRECALVHLKEDLSLGPVQSACRYAEGSYMSVFESQSLSKSLAYLRGICPKLWGDL
jgi:hypothetical protein